MARNEVIFQLSQRLHIKYQDDAGGARKMPELAPFSRPTLLLLLPPPPPPLLLLLLLMVARDRG